MMIRSASFTLALLGLCMPQLVQAQSQASGMPGTGFTFVSAQDGELGSTMTLSQLQQAQKIGEEPVKPFAVSPAPEPSPALRYRLYPGTWELRPGSALLHYARAQILFQQMAKETTTEWQQWATEESNPTDEQLSSAVDNLKHVYVELHELAMSEDFTWDHRIRDLRGPEVYSYLLPDVQEARAMARLLRIRIMLQIRRRDFEGVFSSVSDGFRLAEFVGQGETLIQKLVGVAIAAVMRDALEDAISTPGCPNLYWAIASVPPSLVNISQSAVWELDNIHRVLPVLAEAENAEWSDAEATKKWATLVSDLGTLSGDGSSAGRDSQLALAIASVTFVDSARQRLQANGIEADRLSRLPALQVVLIDAAREVRRVSDDLAKAHLLPAHLADPVLDREDAKYQKWIRDNRLSSVGAAIGGLLYPAVKQVKAAETRMLLGHARLMTLEAIRMYASEHDGQLPKSLDQLSTVPAMPDPFTNKPFGYRVEVIDDKPTLILTAGGPENYRPLQELRATIAK